jgi:hypothetical protein
MGALMDARNAYLEALDTLDGVNVSPHGGRFTIKELERYAKLAPAAVLTLLKFEPTLAGGLYSAKASWGCVFFTKDTQTDRERGVSVIDLVEKAVSVLLPVFNGAAGGRPMSMDARNLFTSPLDAIGIAMWGLEWDQMLDLSPSQGEAVDWSLLHLTWDLAPRDNDADLGDVPEAEDDIELDV